MNLNLKDSLLKAISADKGFQEQRRAKLDINRFIHIGACNLKIEVSVYEIQLIRPHFIPFLILSDSNNSIYIQNEVHHD